MVRTRRVEGIAASEQRPLLVKADPSLLAGHGGLVQAGVWGLLWLKVFVDCFIWQC